MDIQKFRELFSDLSNSLVLHVASRELFKDLDASAITDEQMAVMNLYQAIWNYDKILANMAFNEVAMEEQVS